MTFSPRAVEAAARALCRQYMIDDGFSVEQADRAAAGEMHKNFLKAAQEGISAALAVDGLVLVPVEPTEDMLDFGSCYEDPDGKYENDCLRNDGDIARDVYRAMIKAAIRQPVSPTGKEGKPSPTPEGL